MPAEQREFSGDVVLNFASQPSSINEEQRTARILAYTGADIYGWDGAYTLALDRKSVNLSRIKNGAGLFKNHDTTDIDSQIGVITGGDVTEAGLELDVRFAADAEKEWRRFAQGIYRNFSIGVIVDAKKETTAEGSSQRRFLVTKWTPRELSIVGVPADEKARALSSEPLPAADAAGETETTEGALAPEGDHPMPDKQVQGQEQAPNIETITAAAQQAERERALSIAKIGEKAGLSAQWSAGLIGSGATVEAAQAFALEELIAKQSRQPDTAGQGAAVVVDAADKRRDACVTVLMARIDPHRFGDKLTAENPFRGMGMPRMAEECLRASGHRIAGLNPAEIVTASLQQTTSDFANILSNVANKTLVASYQYANPTYRLWAKRATAPDFKTITRVKVGEFPALKAVTEGDNFEFGSISDGKETYVLIRYGRIVALSFRAIVNDDTGAFDVVLAGYGKQAARLENETVYGVLTANAAMADGTALFHSTHGNLSGASAAPSITTLTTMRAAMRIQKGLDGATLLNNTPKFLIVPAALETVAQQYTNIPGIVIEQQSNFNPFAQGEGVLRPVVDAVLDSSSTTVWYAATDATDCSTVEYCFLQGQEAPTVETKQGWYSDGMEFKVTHNFAAAAIDHRGLYKYGV